MTVESEKALTGADKAKHLSWKYVGAIFMEPKEGVQAVSFHKVLGLGSYLACMGFWTLTEAGAAPAQLFYTTLTLLGLKGVSKLVEAKKG